MEALKDVARRILYPVPPHLKKNQRQLIDAEISELRQSIETNFFSGWRDKSNYSADNYTRDLKAHLIDRLDIDRKNVTPWLDSLMPLHGARILEVGCGTGSSTVALAEQGAHVTALDIDAPANRVARDRCRIHGVKAQIIDGNIDTFDFGSSYDMVIFFACVEHMTIAERLQSLQRVWSRMLKGQLLVIVETPNRLWWFDDHTSVLPFYHWLPDQLAYQCARFSSRENFKELYMDDGKRMEHFLRQGRGVSYHEFDVALGAHKVVSGLRQFQGWRHGIRRPTRERRYIDFLRSAKPGMHSAWTEPYLDLAIGKV
jgi:2-polyprenyl-3-methyl-5-hydroxy-6-metoxy-1,4-benzoquinol methylase